jgi:hypothetical protein
MLTDSVIIESAALWVIGSALSVFAISFAALTWRLLSKP